MKKLIVLIILILAALYFVMGDKWFNDKKDSVQKELIEKAGDAKDFVKDKTKDIAKDVKDKAKDIADEVKEEIGEKVKEGVDKATH